MAGGLNALTGDGDLRPLWRAVHRRLCRGGATPRSVVIVTDPTPEARRAVDRLLGRVSAPGPLRVRLDVLDTALARAGTDSTSIATATCGPVVDRRAARRAAVADIGAAWVAVLDHPAAAEPALSAWLLRVRDQGRLARSGGPRAVIAALDVLAVLPRTGEPVGRPVLSAVVLGAEHALDDSTATSRLVTAGLAARLGVPSPADAAGRAALWAASGVTFDAVSAPALTLGLRPFATGPLTEAAARWADGGVPLPIPAAAVTAEAWRVPHGQLVSVCENPSVIEAAAAKLGPAASPLVCVSGMPGRAVSALLAQLVAAGASLRYHGDFGAGGITIANLVIARHGADAWRMSTSDHNRAVERLTAERWSPTPLRGRIPAARWDPGLAAAIDAYGFEVTEEHVVDELLDDLAAV